MKFTDQSSKQSTYFGFSLGVNFKSCSNNCVHQIVQLISDMVCGENQKRDGTCYRERQRHAHTGFIDLLFLYCCTAAALQFNCGGGSMGPSTAAQSALILVTHSHSLLMVEHVS